MISFGKVVAVLSVSFLLGGMLTGCTLRCSRHGSSCGVRRHYYIPNVGVDGDRNEIVCKRPGGGLSWRAPIDVATGNLAVDRSRVYAGDKTGLRALAARTGSLVWSYDDAISDLVVQDGVVFAFLQHPKPPPAGPVAAVVCLCATSGREQFRVTLPRGLTALSGAPYAGRVMAGLLAVYTDNGGTVLIGCDGSILYKLPYRVYQAEFYEDRLLVLAASGVSSIAPDGQVEWKISLNELGRAGLGAEPHDSGTGGLRRFEDGSFLAYFFDLGGIGDVALIRFDAATGREMWQVVCRGAGAGGDAHCQAEVAIHQRAQLVAITTYWASIITEFRRVEDGGLVGRSVATGAEVITQFRDMLGRIERELAPRHAGYPKDYAFDPEGIVARCIFGVLQREMGNDTVISFADARCVTDEVGARLVFGYLEGKPFIFSPGSDRDWRTHADNMIWPPQIPAPHYPRQLTMVPALAELLAQMDHRNEVLAELKQVMVPEVQLSERRIGAIVAALQEAYMDRTKREEEKLSLEVAPDLGKVKLAIPDQRHARIAPTSLYKVLRRICSLAETEITVKGSAVTLRPLPRPLPEQ
ncbi:hypothetical protein ACFLQU_04495 [Verrucomicrobiota bacterium]